MVTRIKIYRGLQILIGHFNDSCLVTVLNTKLASTSCAILSLYVVIKFGRAMGIAGVLFTVCLIVACFIMMPVLYQKVFLIRVFSQEFRRNVLIRTDKIQTLKKRDE
ncbi:unnamed protein product, partial [Allacma fusca]